MYLKFFKRLSLKAEEGKNDYFKRYHTQSQDLQFQKLIWDILVVLMTVLKSAFKDNFSLMYFSKYIET